LPSPIEFYFDFISPFGYLGSTQIESVAAKYGRSVDWRPVLLGITVLKVMGLKPVPQTPLKGPYMARDVVRLAKLFKVPFRQHDLPQVNSVAASRAFLWIKARDVEMAKSFAHRVFARLWIEGRDITPVPAVLEEAAAVGVDQIALSAALEGEEIKQALKSAVDAAIAKGVFGVPYFIADGEPFWGSDRLWMLEQWLRDGTLNKPGA
jgi:2-hydroxychromene-2-carboxylate isomerase